MNRRNFVKLITAERDGLSWSTAFRSLNDCLDTVGCEDNKIYIRGESMISGERTLRNVDFHFEGEIK